VNDTAIQPAEQVVYLPVGDIRPAPDNPRGDDLGDLTDLANSIRSMDVLQPILVTPREEDGQPPYMTVLGHRRHAAAVVAERDTIKAIVREMSEVDRVAAMHIENVQREDLTPIQEARSLQALIDLGLKQRQLIEKVGKSQSHISKRLALLKLPEDVQADVNAGRLTLGDAVELAKLKSDKKIAEVVKASRHKHPLTGAVTYVGVIGRVGDVLAKEAREAKVRQVSRRLQADGVTVIEYPRGGVFAGGEAGKRLGDGHGRVNILPDEHAGLECHAAAVSPDAEIVYVCTDPDRHAPDPADGEPRDAAADGGDDDGPIREELPDDAESIAAHREAIESEAWAEYHHREREAERAELAAATEHRRAFITDLLRRKPGNAVITHVLTWFIGYTGVSDRAALWLGVPGDNAVERQENVEAFTGHSLANVTRAALAVMFDDVEGMASASFAAFLDADVREHLGFLIANGYKPTDIERRGLDQTDGSDSEPEDGEESGEVTDTDGGEPDDADELADADEAAADEPAAVAEGDAA
jgi:ParB/RepB/Spo0J family partition protein